MNMMTKGLSVEYAPLGVRINALATGLTTYDIPGENGDEYVHNLMGPDSLTRAADPKEVADAAVWLASDEASYVAGAVIPVDGGVISTMRNYDTGEILSSN
jgi:NAD(P)-dependent dehydrogenase (short-subunit alcohol dehydrogenase family)